MTSQISRRLFTVDDYARTREAWSADGQLLASGSLDGSVQLWTPEFLS